MTAFTESVVEDAARESATAQVTVQANMHGTMQVTMQVLALLEAARTPRTRDELMQVLGLRNRDHFRKAHIAPLVSDGLLAMTMPDKPRSSKQRYQTTPAGEKLLKERS